MKKILFVSAVMAAAVLAFSCESDPVLVESVSLSEKTKSMKVGETATLTATILPENADDKSVTWSSSDQTVATVDANGLVSALASGKTTVTVTSADGLQKDQCELTVTLKDALYSFTSRKYMMSASANVEVNLVNPDGSMYVAEEEIVIPVKVKADETTAVEGTNFKFKAEPKVVIPVGKSSATVVLDCLQQEAGKDVVVLEFNIPSDASYLLAGQYVSTRISILGSYADQIKGTWVMNSLQTDAQFMNDIWYGMFSMDEYPTFNAEDKMTFGDNGLETSLKSELKNFFKEQSDIALGEEMELHANITGFRDIRKVQLLKLSNTNRYFTSKETSQDTEAFIGVRITEEGLLEVFLIDCEYKAFFKEYGEFFGYNPTKPFIGDSSQCYVIFDMKRAQ